MTDEELDVFVEQKLTEMTITILENIKSEIEVKRDKLGERPNYAKQCKMQGYSDSMGIINKHIEVLKGENNENRNH